MPRAVRRSTDERGFDGPASGLGVHLPSGTQTRAAPIKAKPHASLQLTRTRLGPNHALPPVGIWKHSPADALEGCGLNGIPTNHSSEPGDGAGPESPCVRARRIDARTGRRPYRDLGGAQSDSHFAGKVPRPFPLSSHGTRSREPAMGQGTLTSKMSRVDFGDCGSRNAGSGLAAWRVHELRVPARQACRPGQGPGPGLHLPGDLRAPMGPVRRDLERDVRPLHSTQLSTVGEEGRHLCGKPSGAPPEKSTAAPRPGARRRVHQ
jgi:hypothetical protein